jgi:glycosyltransferase involved in cell wall biosynthesis
MKKGDLRVLALCKYGELAASSRQRMVQYRAPLAAQGIHLTFEPLLPDEYVKAIALERGGSWLAVARGYGRRIRRLFSLRDFDVAWVQADLLPYMPGFVEATLLRSAIPIVYDCDDAIFHNYDLHRNPLIRYMLGRKMRPLLRRARAAMCGNDYLKTYVEQYCAHSIVIPTVVDTSVYGPREAVERDDGPTTIGWIGSPSTWGYVAPLLPLLQSIVARRDAAVRAVGVGARSKTIEEFQFVDWSLESEVTEIRRMDIGIMPLTDDPWSRGKCGYKLIQYMACGLPVVASPVGVNAKIVKHGENGFLASTVGEWEKALGQLIADPHLRARMGAAGRALVAKEYSLDSQAPRVAETLRMAAA